MQLEEFYDYKNRLMRDLITNEKIVALLTDDGEFGSSPEDLPYKQIYPFEWVPETIEHGYSYICFEVDIQKAPDKTFLLPVIYIWVFCHNSKIRLPDGGGVRTDAICSEIAKAINGSRYYGLGELDLYSSKRFAPMYEFNGKVLTFYAKDYNRPAPRSKDIPSNRKQQ